MTTTVIALSKVQWARFGWRNQFGLTLRCKPRRPSVNGRCFDPKEKRCKVTDGLKTTVPTDETLLEYATRLNLLDRWEPVVRFQFAANHSVSYLGKKAQSLWKEWGRRQFGKKKDQ